MAKSMKNPVREQEKLLETRIALVNAAIESGKISRREICETTGLNRVELQNVFTKDRNLFAKFIVWRKTMAEAAVDNLQEVLYDKTHPKNIEVSKFILNNYKSELETDNILTPKSGELEIKADDFIEGESNSVVIKFSTGRNKENE